MIEDYINTAVKVVVIIGVCLVVGKLTYSFIDQLATIISETANLANSLN